MGQPGGRRQLGHLPTVPGERLVVREGFISRAEHHVRRGDEGVAGHRDVRDAVAEPGSPKVAEDVLRSEDLGTARIAKVDERERDGATGVVPRAVRTLLGSTERTVGRVPQVAEDQRPGPGEQELVGVLVRRRQTGQESRLVGRNVESLQSAVGVQRDQKAPVCLRTVELVVHALRTAGRAPVLGAVTVAVLPIGDSAGAYAGVATAPSSSP